MTNNWLRSLQYSGTDLSEIPTFGEYLGDDCPTKDEVKYSIFSQINSNRKVINFEIDNLKSDIVLFSESGDPILDILIRDRTWDKGRVGLVDKDVEEILHEREQKHHNRLDFPLYICESSKRIDETAKFANHWLNHEYNELYRMHPNRIKTINFLR